MKTLSHFLDANASSTGIAGSPIVVPGPAAYDLINAVVDASSDPRPGVVFNPAAVGGRDALKGDGIMGIPLPLLRTGGRDEVVER